MPHALISSMRHASSLYIKGLSGRTSGVVTVQYGGWRLRRQFSQCLLNTPPKHTTRNRLVGLKKSKKRQKGPTLLCYCDRRMRSRYSRCSLVQVEIGPCKNFVLVPLIAALHLGLRRMCQACQEDVVANRTSTLWRKPSSQRRGPSPCMHSIARTRAKNAQNPHLRERFQACLAQRQSRGRKRSHRRVFVHGGPLRGV